MLVVTGGDAEAVKTVDVVDTAPVASDVDELPTLLVCHLIRERVMLVAALSPLLVAVWASASFAAGLCGRSRPDAM